MNTIPAKVISSQIYQEEAQSDYERMLGVVQTVLSLLFFVCFLACYLKGFM